MLKLLSPEVAIIGAGLIALFVFGCLILWFTWIGGAEEEDRDTSDTAAQLMFQETGVALAHPEVLV